MAESPEGRWRALSLVAAVLATVLGGAYAFERKAEQVPLPKGIAFGLADIAARDYPRPVHRGVARGGHFGDAIDQAFFAPPDLSRLEASCPASGSVTDPVCQAFLDATRPKLQKILDATLESYGGLGLTRGILAPLVSAPRVAGASGFADLDWTRGSIALCKRAAAEIRAEVAASEGSRALTTCADAFALVRDFMLGDSTMMAVSQVACGKIVLRDCEAALEVATPDDRHELARELGVVRAGLPSLGQIGRDDLSVVWLRRCGELVPDEAIALLPAPAQAIAGDTSFRNQLGPKRRPAPRMGMRQSIALARDCREEGDRVGALWSLASSKVVAAEPLLGKYQVELDGLVASIDGLIASAAR